MKNKKISLITPGHVASNPRLVKEADALSEAGYDVTVYYCDTVNFVRYLDKKILDEAKWKYIKVKKGSILVTIKSRILYCIFALFTSVRIKVNKLFFKGLNPNIYQLEKYVLKEKADLYIAHNLAALPVAFKASSRYNAKLGFDAEDYHLDEINYGNENHPRRILTNLIQKFYLPKCDYLSSSSPNISKAYLEQYNVKMETILNVFPLSEAREINSKENSNYSLYWFSQTIGPGRGIESIIQSIPFMKEKVDLYLRGSLESSSDYIKELKKLINRLDIGERVHFLPSASPKDMIMLASMHDIGLSTELKEPYNRNICLTNKIFTYLLAGIPVLLSKTDAQLDIAKSLGEACLLVDIDNQVEIANVLDCFFQDENKMKAARKKAHDLGNTIFNWDVEKKKYISMIKNVLD